MKYLVFLLALVAATEVSAQVKTIRLKDQRDSYSPQHFYIASVADDRKDTIRVSADLLTASDDEEHIVFSPGRPLKRQDFAGTPDDMSRAGAVTFSGILVKYHTQTRNNRQDVHVSVMPYFHKRNSWWQASQSTEEILSHEQLHFDITAIAACQLMEAINTTVFTPGNFEKELETLHRQSEKARTQMQQQYDSETGHSLNRAKQEEWKRRIKRQLAGMNCYRHYK